MSDKFEDAVEHIYAYYAYKRRSDSNQDRTMWFNNFAKYAETSGQDEGVISAEDYPTFMEAVSFADADNEAYTLYRQAQESGTAPDLPDITSARTRLRFLAAVTQSMHRQFLGTGMNAGDRLNNLRYDRERKVAASGLLINMKERVKKQEQQEA